jgi:hypothetical protein
VSDGKEEKGEEEDEPTGNIIIPFSSGLRRTSWDIYFMPSMRPVRPSPSGMSVAEGEKSVEGELGKSRKESGKTRRTATPLDPSHLLQLHREVALTDDEAVSLHLVVFGRPATGSAEDDLHALHHRVVGLGHGLEEVAGEFGVAAVERRSTSARREREETEEGRRTSSRRRRCSLSRSSPYSRTSAYT